MTSSSQKAGQLFARARAVMPSGYTRHMVVQNPYPLYADRADIGQRHNNSNYV